MRPVITGNHLATQGFNQCAADLQFVCNQGNHLLINMHVTFVPQDFEAARTAKQGMEQVSEVTE